MQNYPAWELRQFEKIFQRAGTLCAHVFVLSSQRN